MALVDLSKIKSDFFSRFPDPAFFDCGDFNLLKVVLEAIKVDYFGRGIRNSELFLPEAARTLKRLLRQRHKKKIQGHRKKLASLGSRPYIFVDSSGRVIENERGEPVSLYFARIKKALPGKIAHLVEKAAPPRHDYDLCVADVIEHIQSLPEDQDDTGLRKNLLEFYDKLNSSALLNERELVNVRVAFQKFFREYRGWKFILSILPQRKFFLICHYHKEGAILAMKRTKRLVVELQHGLISKNDLFYCFPPEVAKVRERALFPDKILVYGDFWKNKLSNAGEFALSDIEVIGHYHAEEIIVERPRVHTGNILIATQTYLHNYFLKYINTLAHKLAEKQPAHKILVKLHPAENPQLYISLQGLPGVEITNTPVSKLLLKTDAQISVYSTTLFEGVKFGVPGFSLDVPECKAYTKELEEDGVSKRVGLDFDFFSNQDSILIPPSSKDLFAPFNVDKILNA